MKTRPSLTLYTYWNEVRGDRKAPRRFEIEPARIAPILPDTFILERNGDMDIRYRLAGTRIAEQFGRDFRGLSFFDGFTNTDRQVLERQFRDIVSAGTPALLEFQSITARGRQVIHEVLLLPLYHIHDRIDRFVGSMTALETPEWLGEEPLPEQALVAMETLVPHGTPPAEVQIQDPPVMEPHIRTARMVRAKHRFFRVYDGGLAGARE